MVMSREMTKKELVDWYTPRKLTKGKTAKTLLREDKSEKTDWTYISEMRPAFERVIKRFQYGEKKYARLNFRNCKDYKTYEQSALRHLIQALSKENGEDHLASCIVNILIIMDGEK
jgi:hypothetical protein